MLISENYFNELYYSNFHSGINSKDQSIILENFKKSKYGILSGVYCLSEGWDFPLLDGVVFAENMVSTIRIFQTSLRPLRKNYMEPNNKKEYGLISM